MKNAETAKRLRFAMERAKLTAKELSDKANVSEPSISQYLHGVFAPRSITAGKLAGALDVSPMWLMGFDVPMENVTYSSPAKEVTEWLEASFPDLLIDKVRDLMREMNDDGKKKVLDYARDIVENDKYRFEKKGDDALCGLTDPADASAL